MITITTPRLTLRPSGLRYLKAIHPYTSDPENTRLMTNLPNDDIDECAEFLSYVDVQWEKDAPDFYEFAIFLDDTLIGTIGLTPEAEDRTRGELGWVLNKAYWGNGYATEAARALVEYAAENLGVRHFTAHCDSENTASYRVMEKLGMRRTGYWRGRRNMLSDEDRGEFQYDLDYPDPHPMRRRDRELTEAQGYEILRDAEYGVLSTVGADGYPYGVPVNYALMRNAIYIHCAPKGYRLANIHHCEKVSFSAVRTAEVLPAEFSTAYESVVIRGTAREITDEDEKLRALAAIVEKYAPSHRQAGAEQSLWMLPATAVIRIDILSLTAKARKKA